MIAKIFLGTAVAAVAIGAAAPASADGSPFRDLCTLSRCSSPGPAASHHSDISQIMAGIQQGEHDMQAALSAAQ